MLWDYGHFTYFNFFSAGTRSPRNFIKLCYFVFCQGTHGGDQIIVYPLWYEINTLSFLLSCYIILSSHTIKIFLLTCHYLFNRFVAMTSTGDIFPVKIITKMYILGRHAYSQCDLFCCDITRPSRGIPI